MQRSTMLLTSVGLLVTATALAVAVSACGSSDPPPATSPSATAYPPGQYPPGQYPQQPPPQGGYYPPPQQTGGYPPPQPTGGYPPPPGPGPAPTAAATMATPGPLALPCQNDGACGFHKCNMQFQKCAFPCQTPADCGPGNQCMMGVCAPKPPGSP